MATRSAHGEVTDFSFVFDNQSTFNESISGWDVSAATDMSNMFSGASKYNQNMSQWNVSSVMDMTEMFYHAASFNVDIIIMGCGVS